MKRKFSAGTLVALAFAFVVAVFAPLMTYLNNVEEFPRAQFHLLVATCAVACLALAAALASAFFALGRISRGGRRAAIGVFAGLALALYAQGNLIGLKYGVLDGRKIDWDALFVPGCVNTAIWVVLVGLTAFVVMRFGNRLGEWVRIGALAFVAYLTLTLCLQFASSAGRIPRTPSAVVSEADLLAYSKDRNLAVVILDAFDQKLFAELLEKRPETADRLRGFTWYRNTIGFYPTTVGALPWIMTGVENDNSQPRDVYTERAFCTSPVLSAAAKNGFTTDIYTSQLLLPPADLDGVPVSSFVRPEKTISSAVNAYLDCFNAAEFIYLPHFLKCHSDMLALPLSGCDAAAAGPVGVAETRRFERGLSGEAPLEVRSDSRRYKVIHTPGTHYPDYNVDRAVYCIGLVESYVCRLREAGLLDKTDLVVMADHGVENQVRPLFMTYDRAAARFAVSDVPFSYVDLPSVLIGALEGGGLKVPAATGPRRFHWYTWNGKWDNRAYLPTFSTLYFDESGMRCLPPDFKAKDEYRPDEICLLPSDGIADGQDLSGEWVWTVRKDAWIDVPVPESLRGGSFTMDVRVMPILGARRSKQTVRFTVGGKAAGEQRFSTAENWEKTVSLKVGPQQVREGVVRVGFSLELPPERVCDIMDGNPDVRKLGLGFRWIRLKR